jgi:UDP-N-acetylmuramate dehydrogenase
LNFEYGAYWYSIKKPNLANNPHIMTIKKDVQLAPLTTLGVGGPAEFFAEIKTEDELLEAFDFANKEKLPIFTLGGGSNILVADEGAKGLVMLNKIMGFKSEKSSDHVILKVGAGENWDETVKLTVKNGWYGLECLSGIPGNVGATPVQNIGAYGSSIDKVVKNVQAFDTKSKCWEDFDNNKCEFSYRNSVFKRNLGRYIITQVTFKLALKYNIDLSYQELEAYFKKRNNIPTLEEVRKAIIEIRSRKGMVTLPEYEKYQSAGSFFKNPVTSISVFEKVRDVVGDECPNQWFWQIENRVKISAACLIQQAGFTKGYKEGNVGISPKHTLAIINYGDAKASELVSFAKRIQKKVLEKFGVLIEPEVQTIGFENNPFAT